MIISFNKCGNHLRNKQYINYSIELPNKLNRIYHTSTLVTRNHDMTREIFSFTLHIPFFLMSHFKAIEFI